MAEACELQGARRPWTAAPGTIVLSRASLFIAWRFSITTRRLARAQAFPGRPSRAGLFGKGPWPVALCFSLVMGVCLMVNPSRDHGPVALPRGRLGGPVPRRTRANVWAWPFRPSEAAPLPRAPFRARRFEPGRLGRVEPLGLFCARRWAFSKTARGPSILPAPGDRSLIRPGQPHWATPISWLWAHSLGSQLGLGGPILVAGPRFYPSASGRRA